MKAIHKQHIWSDAPNFRDPSVMLDPNPHYERMFERGSPFYVPHEQTWYIFDHAHITAILKDKGSSANRFGNYLSQMPTEKQTLLRPFFENLGRWLTFIDDHDHRRLRAPLQKAFTSKIVAQWEHWLRHSAQTIIRQLQDKEEFDVVAQIALPLPRLLICEMLGIPPEDSRRIKGHYWDIVAFFDRSTDPVIAQKALQSNALLSTYMHQRITQARKHGGSNLFTYLLALQKENADFCDQDLAANAILLLGAGHETTTSLIASATHLLYDNPQWKEEAQKHEHIRERIIEEALRLHPPLQRTSRITRNGIQLGNLHIPPGDRLCLLFGAGNRDPKVFFSPNQPTLHRNKNPHLAFSGGPHFCVGANIAKLEADIVLQLILEQFFDATLKESSLHWEENMTFRSLKRLVLTNLA